MVFFVVFKGVRVICWRGVSLWVGVCVGLGSFMLFVFGFSYRAVVGFCGFERLGGLGSKVLGFFFFR